MAVALGDFRVTRNLPRKDYLALNNGLDRSLSPSSPVLEQSTVSDTQEYDDGEGPLPAESVSQVSGGFATVLTSESEELCLSTGPSVVESAAKRRKMHTSWTQDHFWITELDVQWSKRGRLPQNDRLLVCKRCSWSSSDSSRHGTTSNLLTHLRTRHRIGPGSASRESPARGPLDRMLSSRQEGNSLEQALVRWVVQTRQPFTTVEPSSFKAIFDTAGVQLPLRCADTLRDRVKNEFEDYRSLLYDLPPMVTLRARQLPLPAPEGLWEARTAKEWNAERLKQDLDQNPLSLDDWVEILYKDDDDDIPVMTMLSSFSRFLAILAITQDIGEYVRASKKFARLHHKHTHEEETRITTKWTALLTRCHDVLCQTPCFEESWPLHRQLISQAYHCTMVSMQATYKDLYGFVGYKASSREVDVTRYRLSSWMMEQPDGMQTALVHAVRILVHMRIDKPKNPHAALMVCIATLTVWVFLDLKLGSPSPSDEAMDMGRCPACRDDIRASLDRCCLKRTFGHDLSTFEIDLIRGTVSVERLVHESCDLLKTVTFWQISNGIISSLNYHYQLTKGSTNSARL
ncbi:uncharacterized protein Z518_10950 [Rhinocladiella mackenziei CBS 650.93]|uniref:BED-type domain-containing protein n=1 Tax=Rhinocladiella mackenziei CBS 650.93 TaxID=1442369 RepID=A0A0D2GNY0_9EURO|nr:uncharacterized protein Z518_10950 [Rhinocladiella mackenziei CBS 650.93]KIX00023.1 hypothetical protein Z518_10950 [Rhinocladiella mackenziei CBS 650.93]